MTTRLGEGLAFSPKLNEEACERTAQAVSGFVSQARSNGADNIFAFATAAVRSAANPELFLDKVRAKCGIAVDVISGEREAEIAVLGALKGCDGGIIDVGGASTEVSLSVNGKIVYTHSANIGTVRILDGAGRNLQAIDAFVTTRMEEYGNHDFSAYNFKAVGGTATRLATVKLNLKEYSPEAVEGVKLTREEVRTFAEKLTKTPVEEIRRKTILNKSADLIGGGAALLAAVMNRFKIAEITVTESDNMEGYLATVTK